VIGRRVVVAGRVQGVGFRWSAQREAQRLGVTGWVRNRPDGSVETVIEGPEPAVESMVRWLHRGPSSAAITSIEVVAEEPSGAGSFVISS
jgi:acylphosphatase